MLLWRVPCGCHVAVCVDPEDVSANVANNLIAVQCSGVQRRAVQCSVVQCSGVQCSAMQCGSYPPPGMCTVSAEECRKFSEEMSPPPPRSAAEEGMQGIELHLGFKLHSKESGSRWARTSNIEIDLGMGGLKLGVKSLSISGELVVRLEPLLQEMPVIGGVVVCCLIRPRLEMEFSGLAMHMDRLGRTSHSHTAMGSASAKRRAMACFHRDGSPTFRERGNPSRLPHRSSAGASPSLSASPPVSAESPGRPKRRLASGWGVGGHTSRAMHRDDAAACRKHSSGCAPRWPTSPNMCRESAALSASRTCGLRRIARRLHSTPWVSLLQHLQGGGLLRALGARRINPTGFVALPFPV